MRYATFQRAGGEAFRLLAGDGTYRDFNGGVLAVDDSDSQFDWLLVWAKKRIDITVTIDGKVQKVGSLICSVCGQPMDTEDQLAEHTAVVHVEPDEDEDETPPPRSRRGR